MTIDQTTEPPKPVTRIIYRGWATGLLYGLFKVGVYLGIGALCHALLLGPTFDRDSLWSWGWILAWPVGLIGLSAKWVGIGILVILGLALIAWVGWVLWKAADNRLWLWKERRRLRRNRTDNLAP